MTVVYDLLALQSKEHGERGIARYVLNLALALERTNPGLVTHYLYHPDMPVPDSAEPLIATGRLTRSDEVNTLLRPTAGGVFLAGSLFEMDKPLDQVLPVWCRSPYWRTMAVAYDLIPLRFDDRYLSDSVVRYRYMARTTALTGCDHLLAISQRTLDDVVELLGYRRDGLTSIGAGAGAHFRPPSTDPASIAGHLAESGEVPGLRPGYLLFPTGIEWRKNVERTVEAYAGLSPEIRARHQLVLLAALNDYGQGVVDGLLAEFDVAEDLLTTDFVSDETLVGLYQGAEAVIFPSLYEGFGLPALEAMRCGAPVLCADTSSLKEVQTWPEARFDPTSTSSIADAMERVLTDDGFRDQLRSQEPPPYTWDRAANLTATAVRTQQAAVPSSARKPRLALLSPLPPQQSGIATYAYRMLEHLKDYCDITVFVEGDMTRVRAPEGVEIHPVGRIDSIIASGGAFDRILYFMGNSTFHVEMLEVLKRHPGVVLCHDVRLTGLYSEVQRLAPERLVDQSVGATLAALYPSRYRAGVERDVVVDPETAERFGIVMVREVVSHAHEVYVHSNHAASLVRIDTGADAHVVFPIPCPEVASAAEIDDGRVSGGSRDDVEHSTAIVSTFGMIAPSKDPVALIEAMAIVKGDLPQAVLELVGEIEPSYRKELDVVIDRLGIASSVRFLGRLDDDAFRAAQGRASVAVQLRAVSNGESSAAVSDLLSQGVPTVVTNIGAMSEYPPDVVVNVPIRPDPAVLAEQLVDLLATPARRRRLGAAASAYAGTNGFDRAAEILAKTLFA